MKNDFQKLLIATATAAVVLTMSARADDAKATEPLKLQLPAPTLKGTPEDLPTGPNIEAYSDKPRPDFLVPKGVKNLSAGKPVTSSTKPFTGELSQITDGKKEAFDYDSVETKKGTQWVQVDLGAPCEIYAIAMWHDHRYIQVMRDVIVQVSDDPDFKTGVTTLFNNDTDNSSGLGVGTDREYFETKYGRIVDGKGTKARYVRAYTKGSSLSALNCWEEIEVYGLPAKSQAAIWMPATGSVSTPPPVIVQQAEAEVLPVTVVTTETPVVQNGFSVLPTPHATALNSVRIESAQVSADVATPVHVTVFAPESVSSVNSLPPSVFGRSSVNWLGTGLALFTAALLLIGLHAFARDRVASASFAKAK